MEVVAESNCMNELASLKSISTPVQQNLTFANYPTNNIYGDVSIRRTL
jgi:hypothetical protein